MMKANVLKLLLVPFVLLSCSDDNQLASTDRTLDRGYDIEERLAELDIQLVTLPPPTANFIRTSRIGNIVFLSGHGPDRPEGGRVVGKVGSDLTLEEGQEAARLAGISLLSSLKTEIGDLNKVRQIAQVTGMVNADTDFTQHSQVINGFSDLMVEIFGETGKHTRAAVGMGSLPFNMAVEIAMIVEVAD